MTTCRKMAELNSRGAAGADRLGGAPFINLREAEFAEELHVSRAHARLDACTARSEAEASGRLSHRELLAASWTGRRGGYSAIRADRSTRADRAQTEMHESAEQTRCRRLRLQTKAPVRLGCASPKLPALLAKSKNPCALS